MNVGRVTLSATHRSEIRELLRELAGRFDSTEDARFLNEAALWAQELPRELRRTFHDLKLHETHSVLVVSGYPIDDRKIGPTKAHWKERNGVSSTLEEEMLLVLLGSLLGEPIGWSTQQAGYVVHDILPIAGHEKEQLGSGSEELLTWHTEDAFHPYRGDYLGMFCLRNPDRVATTVATVESLRLTADQIRTLFDRRYTIRPDESHLPKNRPDGSGVEEALAAAYDQIARMNEDPERIAVLFGDLSSPYLRLDPYFMDPVDDPEGQTAYEALVAQIDGNLFDLVLEPGDCCFIDNFRAVHGRQPFKARHDGRDRWLKRINVARDLRRSRDARRGPGDRIIS